MLTMFSFEQHNNKVGYLCVHTIHVEVGEHMIQDTRNTHYNPKSSQCLIPKKSDQICFETISLISEKCFNSCFIYLYIFLNCNGILYIQINPFKWITLIIVMPHNSKTLCLTLSMFISIEFVKVLLSIYKTKQ